MDDAAKHVEIEIKLRLAEFPNYLKLVGFLGQIEDEVHQVNGFFDSEDRRLSSGGWAFRIRVENTRGLVTVKSLPTEQGMAVMRQEIEQEISRGDAYDVISLQREVLTLPVAPVAFIKEQFPGISLAKLIQFETIRQRKQHRIGDHYYTLELDKTEFSDGSCDYELEVEVEEPGLIETVESHLGKLFRSLGIPFEREVESKLERALNRAGLA